MRVLVIGELHSQITTATKMAKDHGAEVSHAKTTEAAFAQLLEGKGADLLLVDAKLDIGAFISKLKEERIHGAIVAYGIDNDAQAAVRAIKAGAKEYLPLPPDETLIAAILEAIAEEDRSLLYASAAMKKVVAIADRIAPSDASVLITGESGTGKEVIARHVHGKSKRKGKPFISVNCAAIPENLLESELFGHEKGAFTGANHRRIGKFEESSGGTLLLDEISEMDVRLQAKLLRAIQEREIDRVGGARPVPVNLRIIATSNRDLQEEVKQGRFREDLLFRLNVIHLQLPPLRERKEDIPLFVNYFVEKFCEANQLKKLRISQAALDRLSAHPWKGNVRELENTLHRAVLLTSGEEILPDVLDLPGGDATENDAPRSTEHRTQNTLIGRTVGDVEKELILNTLEHCLGNRTKAAQILGISIRTLRNKLNQYEDDLKQRAG